jgi:hypothetical protein
MIAALRRAYAGFRGFDEPGSTVPMMDGPLKPNTLLDGAPILLELPEVDNLLATGQGLLCSSGADLVSLDWQGERLSMVARRTFEAPIASLASDGGGGLALGLDGRGVLLQGGRHDGRRIDAVQGRTLLCPTALLFADPDTLLVANGANDHQAVDWKRDLMSHGASGSVWRVDLAAGAGAPATLLADRLAFPCGLAVGAGQETLVTEAWRHRVVRIAAGRGGGPQPVLADLPAYPGRLAPAAGGGFWLALFAPRNQLVEFVLREEGYRRRMVERIDPAYWIAPSLSSGASYLEPIQGGARKKLNIMKPWAPSWSYGLVLRCDLAMRPLASLHSRADGRVHGVTAVCQAGGRLLVAARGSGVVVGLDAASGGRTA